MAERMLEIAEENPEPEENDGDSDFDDDDFEFYNEVKLGPNSQMHVQNRETAEDLSKRFAGRISVDKYDGAGLQSEAANRLISSNKKATANRLAAS